MLEILENFSCKGYESIAERAGNLKFHITEAVENGRISGYIAYAYDNGRTVVLDYDDGGDLYLCDGLVRSVIFKSCMKNISTAVFSIPDSRKYENLKKLRFLSGDSVTAENIERFMDGCKNCKKTEKGED